MPTVVFYDLETTGLDIGTTEVLQIGARCEGFNFNKYIMPKGDVEPGATAVNGLEVYEGRLHKNGVPVRTSPAADVWADFIDFLYDCGEYDVVLTAHNGFKFDHFITMRSVTELGLRSQLLEVARLGSDTKFVFPPEDRGLKLSQVAAKYGVSSFNAHDALGDIDMMRRLCRQLDIYSEHIIAQARPLTHFG